MLAIRLARTGRNKYPTYRIVAAESARAATGKFVAILGHYNPHTKELVINHPETEKHLGNGAQPSNTVVKLLIRDKVELPKWVKLKTYANKKPAAVVGDTPEAPAADTDVSVTEAAADAVEEPRVGTIATDVAAEGEAAATDIDHTDPAADNDAAAATAEAGEEAAAKAAVEKA